MGKRGGGGINWKIGTDIYIYKYVLWWPKRGHMFTYSWLIFCTVETHTACKATILQQKINKSKRTEEKKEKEVNISLLRNNHW